MFKMTKYIEAYLKNGVDDQVFKGKPLQQFIADAAKKFESDDRVKSLGLGPVMEAMKR